MVNTELLKFTPMKRGTGKTTAALKHLINEVFESDKTTKFYFVCRGLADRSTINYFIRLACGNDIDNINSTTLYKINVSTNSVIWNLSNNLTATVKFMSDTLFDEHLQQHRFAGIAAKVVIDPDARLSYAAYEILRSSHLQIV